ncbi:Chorismate synthase, partial [Dysosmobacter welbionis]
HGHLRVHGPGRGVSARLAEAAGECLGAGSRTAPVHLYLELRPPRNAGHYVPAGENPRPRRVPLAS